MRAFFSNIPKAAYVIFLVALLVRCMLLCALLAYGGEQALLWSDSLQYKAVADSLLAGDGYTINGYVESYRAPGYPLFFVAMGALHIPLWFGSLIQIVIASLLPVLVYFLALRTLKLSRGFSFFAAYLAVFEPVQVYYSVVLLPDVFFAALFTGTLLLLMQWLSVQRVRYMIWVGVLIGLANYIRPAGMYFLIFIAFFFALYMWRHKIPAERFSHIILSIVAMVCVMLPWYIHNYKEFGVFDFVSARSYNTFVYNAAATQALAERKPYESMLDSFMLKLMREVPDVRDPSSFYNKQYLDQISKRVIEEHPVEYFKTYLTGLNTFLFSGNYHFLLSKYNIINVPENVSFSLFLTHNGFSKTFAKAVSLATTPYYFLAIAGKLFWIIAIILSLAGAWFYRKTRLAFLFLISIFYFSVTILSVTIGVEARHRYMLNPLIFLFLAAIIAAIYDRSLRRYTSPQ